MENASFTRRDPKPVEIIHFTFESKEMNWQNSAMYMSILIKTAEE